MEPATQKVNWTRPDVPFKLLDSWIGVTDPKLRKTLQNRLNQRAHRRRQRAQRQQQKQQLVLQGAPKKESKQLLTSTSNPPRSLNHISFCSACGSQKPDIALEQLETLIRFEFANGSPRADLLLGLTQLNIVRALFTNRDILGYKASDMHDDALSAFNQYLNLGPVESQFVAKGTNPELPPSLQPTITQYTIPHHPWLDLIPISKLRDNVIRAGDSIDDLKLCHDMCGYRVSTTGIVIWKEPWDPSGYEVTERFLELWGWTVEDCWELFESTDRWRVKRGERPLFASLRKLTPYIPG
ncbi:conserved hypothetical protein [Talaromyces stipitatus ATCC 10500]|uniref:BZIP domain-containing protein n=1 Tax=Talaromyces stipitatus (strain ATCC 10500 / CBS 375.48 / QM 6759 / NRRL 1006) TaxID=441959 RepID=B8MEF1_TALSN|nr:uncharacterized protein TSTA_016550 [Talaromyces stipitatus ATCC 10500]EED16578.1 conserved hypothetical protein [Talaromyces stipitatus ATCC 10500]